MGKRKLQEINSGSMADIAFLLLVFFIVATTMNVDSGIQRILPPMPEEEQQDAIDVKERNVMTVFVSRLDEIMAAGEKIDITQLTEKTKKFILNVENSADLPEKEIEEIDLIGNYPVSKGIVSLKNDRGTSYTRYIMVQNELTRAFKEVRDMLSTEKFGKKFDDLEKDEKSAIQKAIPLKISEAEPTNIEGGK